MTSPLVKALLADRQAGVQLLYGVATGDNTVTIAGSTVAVELPALAPVVSGDYVAVLAAGADRLILGPVGVSRPGVVDYQQITSGTAAVTTTVTDISGLSVTFTAVPGRRYRITGQALIARSAGAAGDTINLYIRDGSGTQLALSQLVTYAGAGANATLSVGVVVAPTAGSKTYKLSFNGSAGSQTVSASSTNPAWILVEDIGPA